MLGTKQWREPDLMLSLTLAARRAFRITGTWSLPGYRSRRDEIGKDDEVVLIVAGLAVEGSATGDQPQSGVVDVAVDPFGGELILQVLGNLGDAKYRLAAVRLGDRDLITDLDVVQVVEDPRSFHVYMARDDRRTELTWCWPAAVPAGREAAGWNLHRSVAAQAQGHQSGVHTDGGDLQADRCGSAQLGSLASWSQRGAGHLWRR